MLSLIFYDVFKVSRRQIGQLNNNNNTSYIAHLSITMISALRIKNIDKIKTKK